MKNYAISLLAIIIVFNGALLHLFIANENVEEELYRLQLEMLRLEIEQEQLQSELEQLLNSAQEISIPDKVAVVEVEEIVREMVITGYSPLDPNAIEGMCHDGNPNVTFSGEPPIPGETAAGHRDLLGKTVYIEGLGERRINDIGGAIGRDNIDVVFADKKSAIQFGRQKRLVVVVSE